MPPLQALQPLVDTLTAQPDAQLALEAEGFSAIVRACPIGAPLLREAFDHASALAYFDSGGSAEAPPLLAAAALCALEATGQPLATPVAPLPSG